MRASIRSEMLSAPCSPSSSSVSALPISVSTALARSSSWSAQTTYGVGASLRAVLISIILNCAGSLVLRSPSVSAARVSLPLPPPPPPEPESTSTLEKSVAACCCSSEI